MKRLPLPTVELRKLFEDHHGNLFQSNSGRSAVLSFSNGHSQFWVLNDDNEIVDIWNATSSHNEQLIIWSSETTNKFYKYRVGYALGFYPTGERHPAYLITDSLVAEGHALPLEPWGREEKVPFPSRAAPAARSLGAGGGSGARCISTSRWRAAATDRLGRPRAPPGRDYTMIRATPPTDGHRAGMIVLAAALALAWKPVAAQDARQLPPAPLANPASEAVPPPVPGAGNLPNTGNIRPRPGPLTPQRNGRAVGPAAGTAAAPGQPLSLLPPPLPIPELPLAPRAEASPAAGDAAPPAPSTTAVSPAPPLPPGIPAPAARSVASRSDPGAPLPPCPHRLLVRLLAGATTPEDAAAALAIEAEALALCTERQKLIVELHEVDGKLREAWNKGKKKAGKERDEAARPAATSGNRRRSPGSPRWPAGRRSRRLEGRLEGSRGSRAGAKRRRGSRWRARASNEYSNVNPKGLCSRP